MHPHVILTSQVEDWHAVARQPFCSASGNIRLEGADRESCSREDPSASVGGWKKRGVDLSSKEVGRVRLDEQVLAAPPNSFPKMWLLWARRLAAAGAAWAERLESDVFWECDLPGSSLSCPHLHSHRSQAGVSAPGWGVSGGRKAGCWPKLSFASIELCSFVADTWLVIGKLDGGGPNSPVRLGYFLPGHHQL